MWQSSRERKSISLVPRETTTTKILTSGNEDFKILGVRCFLPVGSPRRVQVYPRIDPQQQRVGVPNLDSPSSIFLKRFVVKRTTRTSLFLSFKQPLGVNEKVVTSDRSPPVMTASLKYLWEIVDHGNGNISWENFLIGDVLGLENSCDRFRERSWKLYIFFF